MAQSYLKIADHAGTGASLVREITMTAEGAPVAFSAPLILALSKALDEAEADPRIGAIVLSHEGRAFCAGSDLGSLIACGDDRAAFEAFLRPMMQLFLQLDAFPKPSIAAIEGAAVGGGFELALAADLRVMGPKAWVSLPETGFGTLPGGGGLQRLTHYIGRGRTLDLVMTGDRLSAADCVSLGLARAAQAETAREAALALAARLTGGSRHAQRLAKSIIRNVSELDATTLEKVALDGMLDTLTGPEGQEGLRAIAEKRLPDFAAARGDKDAV